MKGRFVQSEIFQTARTQAGLLNTRMKSINTLKKQQHMHKTNMHVTYCPLGSRTHSVKSADRRDHAAVWWYAAAADPVFMARKHLHPFTYERQKKLSNHTTNEPDYRSITGYKTVVENLTPVCVKICCLLNHVKQTLWFSAKHRGEEIMMLKNRSYKQRVLIFRYLSMHAMSSHCLPIKYQYSVKCGLPLHSYN